MRKGLRLMRLHVGFSPAWSWVMVNTFFIRRGRNNKWERYLVCFNTGKKNRVCALKHEYQMDNGNFLDLLACPTYWLWQPESG